MEYIGMKVIHAAFGTGTITAIAGNCITVEFAAKTSKFICPDEFEKFIRAEKPEEQVAILGEIAAAKAAAAQRVQEEAARQAAAKQAAQEKVVVSGSKPGAIPYVRTQREEGKRQTFFVFQGGTFDKEYHGGYIWAPITNKNGDKPHHWTRMLDIRKGDIILHCCSGRVRAISVAKGACYDSVQPDELAEENLWDREGRRVDCDYTYIPNPIRTKDFVKDILRLSPAKYSPFDKYGSGNMGYLYEISRELAEIFIRETIRKNPELQGIGY